ncbi:MAG: SUMF1/EgtB/PvdO family nonheme iron enzyme [Saprospiraceae bacterium]|nr:formylglycine-generating enzyme family protein [Bacteroidia bacterium]NNE14584.1 SUMF1/EgtB/PvdO family nonheme iron enzyme [Saprospiraceae bacterium]NNL92627.1 SUMF1/EgtB/PvdO family nonheme iron enzyme [Saprospiraceae bacterium]
MKFIISIFILIFICTYSCSNSERIECVSVADFTKFISDTGYQTDAEKYGWSIVQEDVIKFRTEEGADWKLPNAKDSSFINYPVTQVSFNDALAYCNWSKTRLPSYEEYWKLAADDKRLININATEIMPVAEANFVGNVWDLTSTENHKNEIRLAGGSYLCQPKTCNGSNPNRSLFVDKETGNIHIGFSVVR